MKINTPLGILEFSNLLEGYGFSSIESKKSIKELNYHTFDEGIEVLWYFDERMQARTRISSRKNIPLVFKYQCSCGFEIRSGFNIRNIRCHQCQALMDKIEQQQAS